MTVLQALKSSTAARSPCQRPDIQKFAIVIYDEATRKMCMAAALDNFGELFDKAFMPKNGQKRIVVDREVFDRQPNRIAGLGALEALVPKG